MQKNESGKDSHLPQSWEEAYELVPLEVRETIAQIVKVRVYESLEVGDIHQRHLFQKQLLKLQIFHGQVLRMEEFNEVRNAFATFIQIIEGQRAQYPLVTKLFTAVFCANLLVQWTDRETEWATLYRDFEAALFKNNEEVDGKMLLFAAFKAEWLRLSQVKTELPIADYLSLIPQSEWNVHIKRHLFLTAAINMYLSLLLTNRFSIRIPRVVIHLNDEVEQELSLNEGGYPDGVMYLAPGSVPSIKKLAEAAEYGVPHRRTGILEPRGLRLLFGVDINVEIKREFRGKVEHEPGKRFAFVYLPALMPPTEAFTSGSRVNLKDYSYDALTYAEAIRVSRELTKKFDQIESDVRYQEQQWLGQHDRIIRNKQDRKRSAINKALENIKERLGDPNDPHSIFGANFRELKDNYSYEGTAQEKYTHFIANIRAILIPPRINLEVESSENIDRLFKHQVWEHFLIDDDKAELALELLAGNKSGVWLQVNSLSEKDQQQVVRAVDSLQLGSSGIQLLTPELREYLGSKIRYYFRSRAETVRDTREPKGLKQKIRTFFPE